MAKRGRKLCKSSRKWHLAAALRRRCLAQSRHEAINGMVVESTRWMVRLNFRANRLPALPLTKPGDKLPKCSKTAQKSCSAISAGRTLLA